MTDKKIKIAIIGVGNCASSLIQGISFYTQNPKESKGLTFRKIGAYDISDISIVAAFDIDSRKINKSIKEAIFTSPNVTTVFEKNIINCEGLVYSGVILDSLAEHTTKYSFERSIQPIAISEQGNAQTIQEVLLFTKPDFLISYLPVGSIQATEFYANCALEANVSFINATPVFLTSSKIATKFKEKKLLLVGDDIKSQYGATILHRILCDTLTYRGCVIESTYQLNIGGNTDFLNMLDRSRTKSKLKSKIDSVASQVPNGIENIFAGPAEYIAYLNDNKIAYINLNAIGFGHQQINIDIKLSVEDSTNSAGVMVDILRMAKIELDAGKSGLLNNISAFGFKTPPKQMSETKILQWVEKWFRKNGAK